MQRKPRRGAGPGQRCPGAARKAERAAEADSEEPLRCSGTRSDLRVSQSFLHSSRGQETRPRHILLPCHAPGCACMRVCVCKDLPGHKCCLHTPPRATNAAEGSSPELEVTCLPPHPARASAHAGAANSSQPLLAAHKSLENQRMCRAGHCSHHGPPQASLPEEKPQKSQGHFCDPRSTWCCELSSAWGCSRNPHLSDRNGGGTWGWWGTCPGGCRWGSRCSRGWRLVSAACQSSRRCPGGGEGVERLGLDWGRRCPTDGGLMPGAAWEGLCSVCDTLCPLRLQGSPACPASPLPRHRQQSPGFGTR